ncbi:MAG TPA: PrsW family glutamic-type intramembrane protease [Bacteroidales bacterium]|nr:PrsW family glutamic-type intramembrane protease [Bacteroidales bacterium]
MLAANLISAIITLLIAVLIYIIVGLRQRRSFTPALPILFIWGFISILLNVLSVYLANLSGLFPLGNSIHRVIFYSIVIAGFVREFGKFITIRLISKQRRDFHNPADGIIFALMASLGFTLAAIMWNITFMNETSMDIYRSLLVLPANIITAIILGFFMGLGKLRRNSFIDSTTGLFAATIFQAVFEFCFIIADPTLLIVLFAGSILIAVVLVNRARAINK